MSTRILIVLLAGLAAGMLLFAVGCSSDDDSRGDVNDVTDEIIAQIVDSSVIARTSDTAAPGVAQDASDDAVAELNENTIDVPPHPVVLDMAVRDNTVYMLVEDGIVTRNLVSGEESFIPSEEQLNAIVDLGDKILVGGDNLYTLEGGYLSAEDFDLDLAGPITALEQFNNGLMVGTTEGMYRIDVGGIRELATGVQVSHIASGPLGVWVGTTGDGLYYWNGFDFRERYLRRDSTLFDNVTALDYSRNHLYLGTVNGLFVYDGGSWRQYTAPDGLPTDMITAINADDWVIKIGTSRGAVSFFNDEFTPIAKFDGMMVTNIARHGRNLIAATEAGVMMKAGGLVSTLYDGQTSTSAVALEESF